jgi:hypothetical protein
MLKKLTLKKEYGLIAATILLLLVSYQLAFKKTLEAWQLNSSLKAQLSRSADVSFQPAYIKRKGNNLDKIINQYKADTTGFRSNIIATLSALAEKEHVRLTEVPSQDPIYHTDHFIIQKLDFEGDFFSLVKVLNRLQTGSGFGVPRAAVFKVSGIRSNTDENKKLVLEIYLQIVRS